MIWTMTCTFNNTVNTVKDFSMCNILQWIVCVLLLLISSVDAACLEYDVNMCMKPIFDLRHSLNIPDDLQYFPLFKLDEDGLDNYCWFGHKAGSCLENLHGCLSGDKKLIQSLVDSVHYLCKEVLEEYKSYQSCYASRIVGSKLDHCNEKGEQQIKYSDESKKDAICKVIDEQPACVRNAIEPHCGKPAADLMVKYTETAFNPLSQAFLCKKLPIWAIALIILAILAISVCIALCVAAFYKHLQKSITSNSSQIAHRVQYVPPANYYPASQYCSSPMAQQGNMEYQAPQNNIHQAPIHQQHGFQPYNYPSLLPSECAPVGIQQVVQPCYYGDKKESDDYPIKMSQV